MGGSRITRFCLVIEIGFRCVAEGGCNSVLAIDASDKLRPISSGETVIR